MLAALNKTWRRLHSQAQALKGRACLICGLFIVFKLLLDVDLEDAALVKEGMHFFLIRVRVVRNERLVDRGVVVGVLGVCDACAVTDGKILERKDGGLAMDERIFESKRIYVEADLGRHCSGAGQFEVALEFEWLISTASKCLFGNRSEW